MKLLTKIAISIAFNFFANVSSATLLEFDDITGPNTVTEVGTYNGFVFNSILNAVDLNPLGTNFWRDTGPSQSPDFAVLNDFSGDGIITADGGGTFSFQSVYVKSWFGSGDGQVMSIDGLLGGSVVGSVSFNQSSVWTLIIGNFDTIDTLRINNVGTFLIDNLALNESTNVVNDVPEPSSLALLALGLAGIGITRKKKTT